MNFFNKDPACYNENFKITSKIKMHRDYDNKFLLGFSLLSIFDNPDLKFKQGTYIPVYFFIKHINDKNI